MSRNLQTGTFHLNIFGAINSLQTFIGVIIWALNDRIWSTSSIDSVFFFFFKRDATSTTILQHFYNKSWVVSYYWFKFEFSIEITFLTQQ